MRAVCLRALRSAAGAAKASAPAAGRRRSGGHRCREPVVLQPEAVATGVSLPLFMLASLRNSRVRWRPGLDRRSAGRSEAYSSGLTSGRSMYSGWYRSITNEIGRPLTSVRLDVVPIRFGRVFDNRPALQERRLLVVEHEAIAGLPDRRFLDVADAHGALAGAEEAERDGFLVVRLARWPARCRACRSSASSFGFDQLDAADVFERDAAQALVREQVEIRLLDRPGPCRPASLRVSTPRMVPAILVGASISICSPRICSSRSASVGLLVRSMENVAQRARDRVLAAVADRRDLAAAESCRTMLLSRSLMSLTLNFRSTARSLRPRPRVRRTPRRC